MIGFNAETDIVIASINWTLAGNLEHLTLAGSGNLNATGNSLANVLTGNAADNILHGKSGADTKLGGAAFTAASLVNNQGAVGSQIFGFGTVTTPGAIAGDGTIRAAGGTLVVQKGMTGANATAQSDAGGTLSLGTTAASPSTVAQLINNGALSLNTNNVTVNKDYNNANFGIGNAFNARSNVSGAGLIVGSNAAKDDHRRRDGKRG